MANKLTKLPTLFLSHGGGPMFFVDAPKNSNFYQFSKNSKYAQWFKNLNKQLNLPITPKSILIISAHWDTSPIQIYGHSLEKPPGMFYDYYGFPPETYELKYPAPSNPELALKIKKLLDEANISSEINTERGFDHGAFVPLLLLYPEANIPVIQLSLNSNMDAFEHYKIGKSLKSLREEGVLIIGSGFAVHDLSFRTTNEKGKSFINELRAAVEGGYDKKDTLLQWNKFPFSKSVHPTPEHLMPIFVAAGAAGEGYKGSRLNNLDENNQLTSYSFNADSYRFD